MDCGHRRRPFAIFACTSAVVASAAFAIACGGLGLSSASSFDNPSGGGNNGGFDMPAIGDAGSADASFSTPTSGPDAASAGSAPNNPLCNLGIEHEAGEPCDPDQPASPSGSACQVPDGGVSDAALRDDDGGIVLSCHVVVSSGTRTQVCDLAGSGQDGDSCQASADCAPTFECVGMPGQCRHYCCDGDKSCGASAKSFCDIQSTTETNLKVPVCSPVSPCKLLTSSACTTGQTCAVVKDDGTTSCVSIGPAQVGQGCDSVHCADGLTCLGKPGSRLCYQLCRVSEPSSCAYGAKCKGSSQLFSDPDYGLCQ